MISNIPIYRAKRIDNNEYVIGYYSPVYDIHHYIITHLGVDTKVDVVYQMSTDIHKIDPTTLAIHFPDMIDSQGNKIFASLSEDGKGGDCTFMENNYSETFMWDTLNACVVLKSKHYECKCFRNGNRKGTTFNTYTVTGIQE